MPFHNLSVLEVPVFRIRRIFDDLLPVDQDALAQVQAILREQFPQADPKDSADIAAKLRDPLKYRFRALLFVAESRRKVRGFAIMLHAPDLGFCFLDYISALPGLTGGGVGGALYERLRHQARALGARGIFMECASSDPAICRDAELLPANRRRLRFYHRFGASVVTGTAFETPLTPGSDDCPPSLIFDGLGTSKHLPKEAAKTVVRAILERKYGKRCPPGYVDMVVDSFKDDPVRLIRPMRETANGPLAEGAGDPAVVMTVNDRHDIHHVHERGYVESPARIRSILKKLEPSGIFETVPPRKFPESHILAVHDKAMVSYFKKVCAALPEGKSLYPYVFPIRNAARPPKELPVRAGYYCIDTFTPLNRNAFAAARRAVDCALTAARNILSGHRAAYALVRPPGHHAERKSFGGFCYFNSAAIAAEYLSKTGRVAVLDIDFHHGNGAQDIFYHRADVLTLSIHGHPGFAYPYFSGFAEERGQDEGQGYNRNYPLGEQVGGPAYRKTLARALARILKFRPAVLIVCLGLDTAKGDPTGTWSLTPEDFEANGRLIGHLGLPTLVVQEGGYKIPSLGVNALRFFRGLQAGLSGRTLP